MLAKIYAQCQESAGEISQRNVGRTNEAKIDNTQTHIWHIELPRKSMEPTGETQRSSTPTTNQHLVIGRTLWCLMGNPAGYRANHHPPQCLQSSVGQRVSTACLIYDTDYQQLGSILKWSKNLKKQKHQKSKSILQQFSNYFRSWKTEFLEWNWMSQNSFTHLF